MACHDRLRLVPCMEFSWGRGESSKSISLCLAVPLAPAKGSCSLEACTRPVHVHEDKSDEHKMSSSDLLQSCRFARGVECLWCGGTVLSLPCYESN